MPQRATFPVLGVPTTFVTNESGILDLIERAYGFWREIPDMPELAPPATTVRIEVDAQLVTPTGSSDHPLQHRVPDPTRLFLFSPAAVGIADTTRRSSQAYVSASLLEQGGLLVDAIVEPLTLFLLCPQDRQPLHASAVTRGEVAILLAGPSGAGKSTLAYAASRHGFGVLSDEPIFIQLDPRLRVWGRRPRVHLSVDAARSHFPELDSLFPARQPSGKEKIVVPLPNTGRHSFERVGLCLVRRGEGGAPVLEAADPDRAVTELTEALDPGFDLYASTIPARIAAICEQGAWRLTLGDDPHEAVVLLERVAAELSGGSA